jgi:Transmembrane domain of unknown function (DUF3566)
VSKGNADQPTAQVPRGQSSPTRVEVSAEGRQGSPQSPGTPRPQSTATPGPQDQSGNNGPQDRTPTGAANNAPASKVEGSEPASPNGQSKEPRPQPTASGPPVASPSPSSIEQKQAPAPQTSQTQQKQAAAPQKQGPSQTPQPKQGPSQTPQPKQAPNQQQPRPQASSQAASATTQAQPPTPSVRTPGTPNARPAAGGIPVWDPPQPLAPKQPLFSRLGFGKKTEQPEVNPVAPPAQQTPAPVTPPAPTSPSGATASSTQPAPVAGAGPQARTPAPQQQRPAPGSQPGAPTGPGAAVAAGLTAAATTHVGPQARTGQPGTPQRPVRPGETTGRTPAVQGGTAFPAVPPAGPQARMPAEPTDPTMRAPVGPTPHMTPGGRPLPPPVQAFKDAPTMRNMPVGGVPDAGAPEAHHAAKPKVGVARRTRKARLRLSKLDPWSVMKTSFLFSIAAGIMLVAAMYSMWTVLSTSQLFESVNEIVRSVVSTPGDTTPFRIQEYINTQKVMGVTALIACVDVVIFTALATLGSFLYNLAATMLGGLEITLAED